MFLEKQRGQKILLIHIVKNYSVLGGILVGRIIIISQRIGAVSINFKLTEIPKYKRRME